MRRWTFWAVMFAMLVGIAPVALAEGDTEIEWFGKLRARGEHNDNLSDALSGRDDKIGYVAYRANLGARVTLDENVTVVLDGQFIGAWGDEGSPFRGSQTFNSGSPGSGEFRLFNAYAKAENVMGTDFSITLGRQPLVFGDEWMLGDLDFYSGTSWDGVRGDWTTEAGADVSLFWAKGAENDNPEFFYGGAASQGDKTGDYDLYGIWTSWDLTQRQSLDVAALYGFDAQNPNVAVSPDFNLTDKRFTYSFLYRLGGDTGFNLNANLAIQNGTTAINVATAPTEVDIQDAAAVEVTAAWQWEKGGNPFKTWVRIGGYSGDDPATLEVETFKPIAQDNHGRQGYVDFWSGQWGYPAFIGGDPGFEFLQLGFEGTLPSGITLTGLAQRNQSSEKLSTTTDNTRLGEEFAIMAGYDYGDNVNLQLGVAQVFPGTGFSLIAPGFGSDTIRRVFLSTTINF